MSNNDDTTYEPASDPEDVGVTEHVPASVTQKSLNADILRMHERPGKRVRSCATSGRTAFSSPTDAAWIQKAGAPVPMARSSGVTSPSRSRSPRHDAGAPGTRAAARASRAATLIVPR